MRSWVAPLALIGTALLPAQRALGQIPAESVAALSVDDGAIRGRFTQLLLEARTHDLAAGFGLARSLGPATAPLLWDLHAGEKSNARRRITVLAAAILADGVLGDERVLSALDGDRVQLDERLMTCFVLSLGPMRSRAQPQLWNRVYGTNKQEPVPLLQVVGLLASARFPGAGAAAPTANLRDGDPGVAAAAVYAGAAVPARLVQQFWHRDPPAHAPLVWRATFLAALNQGGDSVVSDAQLVARARDVLQVSGEVYATARAAAALVLGRARAFDRDVRPDWKVLQLLAADRRAAATIQPWLSASPQPLADDPARLAVEYVMSRSIETVLADRAAWSGAASIRSHVAVALAWRLLGEEGQKPVDWSVTGLPEWYFVRWASGAQPQKDMTIADPVLEQAATLAVDGRLPREAGRRLLEEALWRWGSHPGLGLWQAQREFVRDLVVAGSLPGNRYQIGLRDHERYVPGGLRHEDDFFDIAVEVYEFLRERVPPIPEECRLR